MAAFIEQSWQKTLQVTLLEAYRVRIIGSCVFMPSAAHRATENHWQLCFHAFSCKQSYRESLAAVFSCLQLQSELQRIIGSCVFMPSAAHRATENHWQLCFHAFNCNQSYRESLAAVFSCLQLHTELQRIIGSCVFMPSAAHRATESHWQLCFHAFSCNQSYRESLAAVISCLQLQTELQRIIGSCVFVLESEMHVQRISCVVLQAKVKVSILLPPSASSLHRPAGPTSSLPSHQSSPSWDRMVDHPPSLEPL